MIPTLIIAVIFLFLGLSFWSIILPYIQIFDFIPRIIFFICKFPGIILGQVFFIFIEFQHLREKPIRLEIILGLICYLLGIVSYVIVVIFVDNEWKYKKGLLDMILLINPIASFIVLWLTGIVLDK